MTTQQLSGAAVWPEDNGTNSNISADSGDFISAAHLGSVAHGRGTNYIETGITLSYNPSGPSVDISDGLAYLTFSGSSSVQNDTDAYDLDWSHPFTQLVSVPAVTNLSLDAGAVNEIYLAIDPTTEDSARFVFGSSVTEPTDPHIKIGEIDTSTDTVTEMSRDPDVSFGDVSADAVSVSDGVEFSGTDITGLDYLEFTPDSEIITRVTDSSPPADPIPFTHMFEGRGVRFYNVENEIEIFRINTQGEMDIPNGGITVSDGVTASDLTAINGVSADTVSTTTLSGDVTGGTDITSLLGANLSINGGALTATDTDTNTQTDVANNGSSIVTNATQIDFADGLEATSDGSGGAVVSDKAREIYMSEYIAPGSVCDTEFDQAISDASTGDTIIFDGDYELTSSHAINKAIEIDQTAGNVLTCSNTANTDASIHFEGGGRTGNTTTTAQVEPGARTVSITDSSVFSAGDDILLMNAAYGDSVDTEIQFAQVDTVPDASTITLDGTTSRTFQSGAYVYNVDLIESPAIRNVRTAGGGIKHFTFEWCRNPSYEHVEITEWREISLQALNCWQPRWINCTATKPTDIGSGRGEAFAVYRSSEAYLEQPRAYGLRRGVDLAWGSHDVTINSPVLLNMDIAGVSVHTDDKCGHFSVHGGVISMKPDGTTGNCIANTPSSPMSVTGTHLIARRSGILALGPCKASDLYIEPVDSAYEGQAINVQHGDVSVTNTVIDDPQAMFGRCVSINTGNGYSVGHVTVDADIRYNGSDAYYLNTVAGGTGETIFGVDIRGNIQSTGVDQAIFIHAEDGIIENVDISADVTGPFTDQIIRLDGAGGVDEINVHDCVMKSANKAIIYDRDTLGASGTVHVNNCKFASGGTSISFNGNLGWLRVSECQLPGSVDASGVDNYWRDGEKILAEGSLTLSGGSGSITASATVPMDVYLDPSGNAEDVDVVASIMYDDSLGSNRVRFTENSTAVGNPTIGYTIVGK